MAVARTALLHLPSGRRSRVRIDAPIDGTTPRLPVLRRVWLDERRAVPGHDAANEDVAQRWRRCLDFAARHGLDGTEVAARFSEEDIADLCAPEHDDAMLERCMETLVDDLLRERRRHEALSVRDDGGAPSAALRTVRCADCRHFRARATHPWLGDCARGAERSAVSGFWATQWRACVLFGRAD